MEQEGPNPPSSLSKPLNSCAVIHSVAWPNGDASQNIHRKGGPTGPHGPAPPEMHERKELNGAPFEAHNGRWRGSKRPATQEARSQATRKDFC